MSNAYSLLPAQRALLMVPHDLDTDIACYMGGMGSGKTMAGVWLGLLLTRLFPGSRGLVGAHSYALLRDTTRARYGEQLLPGEVRKESKSPDNLLFKNGSQIWFRHLSDPARLASMEFSWIHIEEGAQVGEATFRTLLARLRHTDYTAVEARLRKRFRLFITTTPEERRGWLDAAFVNPEQPKPNWRLIRAPTAENRFLLARKPDYISLVRQSVDSTYAKLYLDGETCGLNTARVYRAFNAAEHLSAEARYDPQKPLHLSFDFNVDFMIALAIQEAENNRTLVVAEIVRKDNADTQGLCAAILARFGQHRAGLVIHGDLTGYARHHRSPDTDYSLIRQSLGQLPGFRLRHRRAGNNPRVKDRVNAVNARLKNAAGHIGLLIHPDCHYLRRSLEETRYLPDRFEKEKHRDPKDTRFVIDHPGDALDYYVADEQPLTPSRLTAICYR